MRALGAFEVLGGMALLVWAAALPADAAPSAPRAAPLVSRPASAAPRPAQNVPRPASAAPRPAQNVPRPASAAPRPASDAPRPATAAPPSVNTGPRPLPGYSVEVHRGHIRVYQRPVTWSPWRGTIARAGRFPVFARRAKGGGCPDPWHQLGPDAWACSGWLLPRAAEPTALERLQHTWRPGPYLGVRASRANRVAFYPNLRSLSRGLAQWLRGDLGFVAASRIQLAGQTYLVTHAGGYVAERRVGPLVPVRQASVTLGRPEELPLLIALKETPLLRPIGKVLKADGAPLARYGARTVRRGPRGEATAAWREGEEFVVLSSGEWVRRLDVALALAPPAPPDQVGRHERWVHVDAAERLVFAMEGTTPRRLMVASLGPSTPAGTHRVEQKIVWKDMQQRYGDDPFYLEGVPYVVFFKGDFAFHGAYWHDGLGSRVSHGCLNLGLEDARFLFDWLGPELPPGFHAVYPTPTDPGGVVRVEGRFRPRPWEPPLPSRRRPVTSGSARPVLVAPRR